MAIMVGSARHDENGKYVGGAAGDQLQKSTASDTAGEVSMQTMYHHAKGWYILRPKSADIAAKIASCMVRACNNKNIGYDQGQRGGVITHGTNSTVKTECDCSSLVRACVKEASGKDPGDFTTANEKSQLLACGLFENKGNYVSQKSTPVYNGDVLVTRTKGHTVIVVSGNARSTGTTSSGSGTTSTSSDGVEDAASFSKSVAGTYTVTASALYMRKGAGTNKAEVCKVGNGQKVKCYGYYTTVGGVKWLLVAYGSKTGFCCSSYLRK